MAFPVLVAALGKHLTFHIALAVLADPTSLVDIATLVSCLSEEDPHAR